MEREIGRWYVGIRIRQRSNRALLALHAHSDSHCDRKQLEMLQVNIENSNFSFENLNFSF